MEVPRFGETRNVTISFHGWSQIPDVYVDGPANSPHRYPGGKLCMWYPQDPPERKWVFADGLLALLNLIQAHLFKEAWWRETGEWLGEEAPHRPVKEPEATRDQRQDDQRPTFRSRR